MDYPASYNDDWATCSRTHASFRVFASDLDPDAVSQALGLEASHSQGAGNPVGRTGSRREDGAWVLSTADVLESRDLRRHIDWLLNAIEPNATALEALVSSGAAADVFCFWESRSALGGGPELSPTQMGRVAALGLSVGLDVYFVGSDE